MFENNGHIHVYSPRAEADNHLGHVTKMIFLKKIASSETAEIANLHFSLTILQNSPTFPGP